MKILNRMGPGIDPWCTLLDTDLQLGFIALITTFWAWLSSQFSVPISILHQLLCGDCVRASVNRQYPLALPCLWSQLFHCRRFLGCSDMTLSLWIWVHPSWPPSDFFHHLPRGSDVISDLKFHKWTINFAIFIVGSGQTDQVHPKAELPQKWNFWN